jgi:hypothetical protein
MNTLIASVNTMSNKVATLQKQTLPLHVETANWEPKQPLQKPKHGLHIENAPWEPGQKF